MNYLEERLSKILSGYINLLGRIPDWEGFISHFSSHFPNDYLFDQIRECDEYTHVNSAITAMKERFAAYDGKKRVLLFGAYGNGNLGDRIMAETVAEYLEKSYDIICFSYSELAFAPYPFAPERTLSNADMPLNFRVALLFDAIIIGGGGLLSYPHEPLWDPSWAYTITAPYGLLGCGVRAPLENRLENLVNRAAIVSSRDLPGFEELVQRRQDALLCPDPVLSFAPIITPATKPEKDRLFILRAPFCDWHYDLKGRLGPQDSIVIFEAHVDHEIISWFDDVHSINTKEDFYKLVCNYKVVISERYHGAILSFLAGVPVYGICRSNHADKMQALFKDLGASEYCFFVDRFDQKFPAYSLESVQKNINAIRSNSASAYRKFIDILFNKGKIDVNYGVDAAHNPHHHNNEIRVTASNQSEAIFHHLNTMRQVYASASDALQLAENNLENQIQSHS